VVNIGGKTILTVLRSADSVGESIWQQYKLHKMYRASGHERAVPQPFPELDEATCKVGNRASLIQACQQCNSSRTTGGINGCRSYFYDIIPIQKALPLDIYQQVTHPSSAVGVDFSTPTNIVDCVSVRLGWSARKAH
jgi:hypothetical protein